MAHYWRWVYHKDTTADKHILAASQTMCRLSKMKMKRGKQSNEELRVLCFERRASSGRITCEATLWSCRCRFISSMTSVDLRWCKALLFSSWRSDAACWVTSASFAALSPCNWSVSASAASSSRCNATTLTVSMASVAWPVSCNSAEATHQRCRFDI